MSIPKLYRLLIQFTLFVALAIAFVAIASQLRPAALAVIALLLAVPGAYMIAFVFSMAVIDPLDLWLRRRTRDPIWLMTTEGQEWLSSDEGKEWQARR